MYCEGNMRELYVQTENCLFAKEQSFVHEGGTITSGQLNILIWYKFNLQIIISMHMMTYIGASIFRD